MSRIGRQPILIPQGVEVELKPGLILVKGPQGQLSQATFPEIKLELEKSGESKLLRLSLLRKTKKAKALWGLLQRLIANMVKGVTQGFEKKLEIEGVGYRASLAGNKLVLQLGLSHPIEVEAPAGIKFQVEKNIITISGIDKQLVGQVAAKIRSFRKPEPYKGKGIHYLGEAIRRKPGKKAVAAE